MKNTTENKYLALAVVSFFAIISMLAITNEQGDDNIVFDSLSNNDLTGQSYSTEEYSVQGEDQHDEYVFVHRLYRILLNKDPDCSEFEALISRIDTKTMNQRKLLFEEFEQSHEAQSKPLNDEQYVKLLYNVVLNSEADTTEFSVWVNTLKTKSRWDVFTEFRYSDQYYNNPIKDTANVYCV